MTQETISKQSPLFMEKIVKHMESNPTFKTYVECMVDYNGQDVGGRDSEGRAVFVTSDIKVNKKA